MKTPMKTLLKSILTLTAAFWTAASWAVDLAKLPKLIDLGAD